MHLARHFIGRPGPPLRRAASVLAVVILVWKVEILLE
jgi:hypothetical protein